MSSSLRIASSSARSFFDISVTWAMNNEQASHHWNLKYKKSRLPHLLFSLLAAHLVESTSLGSSKAGCGWMSSAPKDGEFGALLIHTSTLSLTEDEYSCTYWTPLSLLTHFPTLIPLFTHLCSKLQHIPRENFSQLRIISRTLDPMKLWEPTNQKNIAPHEIVGTDKLVENGNQWDQGNQEISRS